MLHNLNIHLGHTYTFGRSISTITRATRQRAFTYAPFVFLNTNNR